MTKQKIGPFIVLILCFVPRIAADTVPFAGCDSDGQVGFHKAPQGASLDASILTTQEAQSLAYYKSADSLGVLAPRGWYCLGTYGSNGSNLYVSPEPIDGSKVFSGSLAFAGPAVQLSYSYGDTSGRFAVAAMIARVFPAYEAFANNVMKENLSPPFTFGPYPQDLLTYRSNTIVEYRTPAGTEGLGTHSMLTKNGRPIEGVLILVGKTPDLLHLSIRLRPDQSGLVSAIVRHVEREALAPRE